MIGIIPFGTHERVPRERFPFVTATLILINIAVFIYQVILTTTGGATALSDFISRYAVIPNQVLAHGWIDSTLITSLFLHGGFMHLISNMLFLMAFGDNVEDRLGHLRYLLFYIAWGIAGTAAHIALGGSPDIPTLGASGAIAGVLGAYLVMHPRGSVKVFLFFFIFITLTRLPAILMIGSWFLMQLFSGLGSLGVQTAQTGGVAVWAHIGGFVAGVASALILGRNTRDQRGWPQHRGGDWD